MRVAIADDRQRSASHRDQNLDFYTSYAWEERIWDSGKPRAAGLPFRAKHAHAPVSAKWVPQRRMLKRWGLMTVMCIFAELELLIQHRGKSGARYQVAGHAFVPLYAASRSVAHFSIQSPREYRSARPAIALESARQPLPPLTLESKEWLTWN